MRSAVIMPTLARDGWDRFVPDLIAQSRPADEIIIVVDRPLPEAEQQQMTAQWPQLRFLFNPANIGITRSLNRALGDTEADIIFRADDDDMCLPRRFERQIELLTESGADFVTSWAEGVADGDEANRYLIRCPVDDAAIRAALMRRNVLVHPTLAFRRAPVMALGGYDESFVNAQDYALYLAGIRAGLRFAAVPEPLVRRYYHAGNISVARRPQQMMYSCAARVLHHAASGDRLAFVRTIGHYALLAATPMWARSARRRLFRLLGRGA